MAEEELIEIVEDDEEIFDTKAYAKARKALEKRCNAANIEIAEREFVDGEKFLTVGIPNGREKRWIPLFRIEQFNHILSVQFEKFTFIGDYLAICSYEDGTIEAIVRSIGQVGPSTLRRRLFGNYYNEHESEQEPRHAEIIELTPEDGEEELKIRLGPISNELRCLSRVYPSRSNGISIFIEGINVSKHDNALHLLEKFSNSLFFQIDVSKGIPLGLVRERRRTRVVRRRREGQDILDIQFPKTEYDEAPLSLYWYARGAVSMPLLQFLAYYQVIEFYFYAYSQEETRKKLRAILKDPTFRLDRDADIGRLLSTVTTRGRGFGDERSQLRATLQACIDPSELRTHLTDLDEKKEFFSHKQKGLTSHKLPIANEETDLRNDVADLIYDIRCKIVHTKGEGHEGETELLLPFSKEAELLLFDIELLQFIARKALIAASSPIRY